MKLPYGANEDNFKKCKKIVSEFTNDNKNLDEATLEIMNIAYSCGGGYFGWNTTWVCKSLF